ncbi:MAG: LuxR C-terminal-related transcriptional regulator [Alphaproteobacteria bacterium]|nr:LuxR C-terminal-related transcriptional regulator [Alphaproteobacteria bacterium]
MFDAIEQFPHRQTVFAVFVLFVFGTSAAEIISEFVDGETLGSMGDDLSRFALSAIVLGIFLFELRAQRRTLKELSAQLNKGRGQLAQLDTRSREIAGQYRAVMQKQFDAWKLTASEQDVVIGMLKGLSFREIAELRETREKTVRQQASAVYRKAGVASRHELAAWFFEDMLEPPAIADNIEERR